MVDTSVRAVALAMFLGETLEDIEVSRWDDSTFEVRPRMRKQGDPPARIKQRAEELRALFPEDFRSCRWEELQAHAEGALSEQQIESDRLGHRAHDVWKKIIDDKMDFNALPMELRNALFHLLAYHDEHQAKQWHVIALRAAFNGEEFEDTREEYPDNSGEYMVLTDEEADERARESTESYVEECVLPEVPESYRSYFNTDGFVDDVLRYDGRGSVLNRWDGSEDEISFYKDDLIDFLAKEFEVTLPDGEAPDDEYDATVYELLDMAGIYDTPAECFLYIYRTN
jgi:hypothetical protein